MKTFMIANGKKVQTKHNRKPNEDYTKQCKLCGVRIWMIYNKGLYFARSYSNPDIPHTCLERDIEKIKLRAIQEAMNATRRSRS